MTPFALTPAESGISISSIAAGLTSRNNDFAIKLQRYLCVESCVLANSARTLLYLLLRHLQSLANNNRTEVLIPGYTCYSVAAAAAKADLSVSLYDLDPRTFQPDMEDVAQKTSPKTLAVIGQHLLGLRSNIQGVARIAHQHGAYFIEDSAQLLDVGKWGAIHSESDFALFSFGRGKPLPLGAGGALIASVACCEVLSGISKQISHYSRKMGNPLLPFAIKCLSHPRLYWILENLPLGLGRTIYDPSFSISCMTSLYRRLGVQGLREMESLNHHRSKIGWIYDEYYVGKEYSANDSKLFLLRYPLLVQESKARNLPSEFGVRRLYPLALCDLDALKNILVHKTKKTQGAREIAKHLITLPTHRAVTPLIAEQIAQRVSELFGKEIITPRCN